MAGCATIVAWASAPARSARAIVRISGHGAHEVLRRVLVDPPASRGAHVGVMRLGEWRLPVPVVRYDAPGSYTGEDAAEILLPGNPMLVQRVLEVLCALEGVGLAGPGEFTARAFLNGKLSLDQAEGVAQAIAARTDAELATARELLAGRAGARHRAWAEELTSILALVEAGIDFTDQEDVVAISAGELRDRALGLREEIGAYLGAEAGREAVEALPRVALVGEPSAGKSTLFNALLGLQRALVHESPGTTRDVLEEELDLSNDLPGAGTVRLMDLPGLDAAPATPIGVESQRLAREALRTADVLVHCDPSGRFGPIAVRDGQRVVRVRTKADLAGAAVLAGVEVGGEEVGISVCGLDGWGVRVLRRAIAESACAGVEDGAGALVPRHRRALREAYTRLKAAARDAESAELAAESLRAALDSLGELTGRLSPDDIIGRIFATFCVGK